MWLNILLVLLALVVLDALVRAFLMLRLGKQIEAKGDYRKRRHKLGRGDKQFVITLLGASSIYGEGSNVEIPFAGALAERLAKQGYKVTVNNLAVSGHRVADVTAKQVPLMEQSDLVVVYAGTKDCLTLAPTSRYLADVHELANALQGQTVVWVTIGDPRLLWLFPIWLRWLFYLRAKAFTKLLKRVISEHHNKRWHVVDFFSDGMAEAKRRNLTVRQMVADGIHLSDEGQRTIAEMVTNAAQV